MEPFSFDKLRTASKDFSVNSHPNLLPRHKKSEKFLAGPIPWTWLTLAATPNGKSLHVAIAVWFLASVKKSATIHLSGTVLRELGVKRKAVYAALLKLEAVGVISCDRGRGRRAFVTILDPSSKLLSKSNLNQNHSISAENDDV